MPKCIKCNQSRTDKWFKHVLHPDRAKPTKTCLTCRKGNVKSRVNGDSKSNACRAVWVQWTKDNACIDCGIQDYRLISADHRIDSNKVHAVSDYPWWSCHGGIPAMKRELRKVVPRCIACHRIKTNEDSDVHQKQCTSTHPRNIRLRQIRRDLVNYVNKRKMDIGECAHCKRGVTPASSCAFDFDHVDAGTKTKCIGSMACQGASYKAIDKIDKEIEKCNLLCAACHHLKTHYKLDLGYISTQVSSKMQALPEFTHDRFFSLNDQEINEPEQRTPEWFERRRNKLTGSKLSQFIFIKTQEERLKLCEEVFEGRKRDPFTEEQQGWCKWGSDHEDHALNVLLDNIPNMFAMEAPMVQHSSCPWIASSPDGFYELTDDIGNTYEKGCIEIKCPAKRKKCNTKPTYYYVLQMYLEMACSGNDKVIFCSWGPDRCRAWRIHWNDELWELLSTMMEDLKYTKTSKALPFDKWSILQYRLKTACHEACNTATPLHTGDGWDPQFAK